MNTLSDTDEGRARLSVWPVYVAAVIVGLVSLYVSIWTAGDLMYNLKEIVGGQFESLFQAIGGPFGLLVAYGIARLRRWGWVCGWLWVPISAFLWVMWGWERGCVQAMNRAAGFPDQADIGGVIFAYVWLVAIVLLMCALLVRWQLFFPPRPARAGLPPRPAGEE